MAANVVWVVSWFVAACWQGPGYNVVRQSISDMMAYGAPAAWALIVIFSLSGAVVIAFALGPLRSSLRPAGLRATIGCVLLALSALGLDSLLAPLTREACARTVPGCTQARQLSNLGGRLDALLSVTGFLLLVLAGFFLASGMQRRSAWQAWARPARLVTIVLIVLALANIAGGAAGFGGLAERLFGLVRAAGVAALAVHVLRLKKITLKFRADA